MAKDRKPLPQITGGSEPSGEPVSAILRRRIIQFRRKQREEIRRSLFRLHLDFDGPFGITHFGDPHLDDDGCNLPLLIRDVECVKNTPYMFAGNVGDLQNNWVGRLAHLYAHQGTTSAEAWQLIEWLMSELPWLYLIKGNHDLWTGEGDPLDYMIGANITKPWGARIALHPRGAKKDQVTRIYARHDFRGSSAYNEIHGPKRAARMGWRDHILVCGHKHVAGYGFDVCPATGLVSHIIRVSGYKMIDSYASGKMDFAINNATPSAVTIIDPNEPPESMRRVIWFGDVEEGCRYLTWRRERFEKVK